MRYFIAKNGSTVIEKQAISGEDSAINDLVAKYTTSHPALTVLELDQTTFDATPCTPPPTQAQIAWAAFKATTPTALQAITYMARVLGLE